MSESVQSRFDLDAEGRPLHQQPLDDHGIRFNYATATWRERGGLTRGMMPRVVSRSGIARSTGVAEHIIQRWEEAVKTAGKRNCCIKELVALDASGRPVNTTAFAPYGLAFYPISSTWRRTRAGRTEVTRAFVAKKTGLSEEQIANWEHAVRKANT
jgi:hypothetical protein